MVSKEEPPEFTINVRSGKYGNHACRYCRRKIWIYRIWQLREISLAKDNHSIDLVVNQRMISNHYGCKLWAKYLLKAHLAHQVQSRNNNQMNKEVAFKTFTISNLCCKMYQILQTDHTWVHSLLHYIVRTTC